MRSKPQAPAPETPSAPAEPRIEYLVRGEYDTDWSDTLDEAMQHVEYLMRCEGSEHIELYQCVKLPLVFTSTVETPPTVKMVPVTVPGKRTVTATLEV